MNNITYTLAFWLLRAWLGVRALFTGIAKFQGTEERVIGGTDGMSAEEAEILADGGAGFGSAAASATETVNVLGFEHYHGLADKGPLSIESFTASPLMPSFMVVPYANVLGIALIVLGITLLAGIFSRITLFIMGLLYVSLTYGFIILEPTLGAASAGGIAYLGIHVALIVAALLLADYNKIELLSEKKFCGKNCKCCSK